MVIMMDLLGLSSELRNPVIRYPKTGFLMVAVHVADGQVKLEGHGVVGLAFCLPCVARKAAAT
jgi:hypothetical protein